MHHSIIPRSEAVALLLMIIALGVRATHADHLFNDWKRKGKPEQTKEEEDRPYKPASTMEEADDENRTHLPYCWYNLLPGSTLPLSIGPNLFESQLPPTKGHCDDAVQLQEMPGKREAAMLASSLLLLSDLLT